MNEDDKNDNNTFLNWSTPKLLTIATNAAGLNIVGVATVTVDPTAGVDDDVANVVVAAVDDATVDDVAALRRLTKVKGLKRPKIDPNALTPFCRLPVNMLTPGIPTAPFENNPDKSTPDDVPAVNAAEVPVETDPMAGILSTIFYWTKKILYFRKKILIMIVYL